MFRMRSIFTVGFTLLISLSLVLVGCGSSSAATPSTTPPATAQYKHIFYIMMENHATNEIIGNTADAPYINQLAGQYGVAMSYMFDGQNLVDQLEAHHLTWKAYMQSMPMVGFTGAVAPVDTVQGKAVPRNLYAVKHNPFFYFSEIRNNPARMQLVVPFTQFAQDIASSTVHNFVWISPDQCNDMHGITTANAIAASVNIPDCAFPASGLDHKIIALGDKFLSATVPMIMNSPAWKDNSAIVIAWDEDDYAGDTGCCKSPTGVNGVTLGGANAPAIIITSKGPQHIVVSDTSYNHYSLLGTIEKLWGLGCLANTCGFSDAQLMARFLP